MALAVLVTSGKAAGRTFTVSVKAAESKAAMAAAWVAVTVGPLVETLQPAPAAATKPSPAGRTSVTVVAPKVATVPALCTTSV